MFFAALRRQCAVAVFTMIVAGTLSFEDSLRETLNWS
jgi:hypothetical protein